MRLDKLANGLISLVFSMVFGDGPVLSGAARRTGKSVCVGLREQRNRQPRRKSAHACPAAVTYAENTVVTQFSTFPLHPAGCGATHAVASPPGRHLVREWPAVQAATGGYGPGGKAGIYPDALAAGCPRACLLWQTANVSSDSPPDLHMLNVVVRDMAASTNFYRRLGMAATDMLHAGRFKD